MTEHGSTGGRDTQPFQTALYSQHLGLGANMAVFAGWDMPLWYKAGAIKEHLAVVTAAGLFDTSHMDVVTVAGGDALPLLERAFTRSLAALRPNRAVYGAFLLDNGACLDDGIIYPFPDGRLVVVVNAGMGEKLASHLRALASGMEVTVNLPEPRLGKLDIQGPSAPAIMRAIISDAEQVFASFPYFSFTGDFEFSASDARLADGTPILLSRTGYTGEIGFEIFLPLDRVVAVWEQLLQAGKPFGLLPCGLAARDSLRAGAVLPLSHQDIGAWLFINHPWEFALPFNQEKDGFTKQFIGADQLQREKASYTLPFAGYDQRRVDAATAEVVADGSPVGKVLSIVSDMAIGRIDGTIVSIASPDKPADWNPRGLACGFVMVKNHLPAGAVVTLRDARRSIEVEIVDDIRPDRSARKKLV
ncbi:MAG: aminomethyl transferase family protein [Planctomycetes bacterium]|nr:aminomethyl transferase family protein [Planctomycetota bacterium]